MATKLHTLPRARTRLEPTFHVDVKALEADLRSAISGEVRFDAGDRALWATDASNYRQIPLGVVLPRDADDVVRAMEIARRHRAPVFPRGGGTSLAGQCTNTALVLDFSKYFRGVPEIDTAHRRARVLPGTILDELRGAAEVHGLTFGPDPATHNRCVIGGMLGNNSCGSHSIHAEFEGPGARTSDNVESLEILTPDGLRMRVGETSPEELHRIIAEGGRRGEIYAALLRLRDRYTDQIRERFPDLLRRVSGYDLLALLPENGFHVARALVGSEGTCVTILEATLSLIPSPRSRVLLVLGYPNVYEAADHVPELREFRPMALEGFDDILVGYMRRKGLHAEDIGLLPEGAGWLMAEFGGETIEEARGRAEAVRTALESRQNPPTVRIYDDPAVQHKLWVVRESGLGATAFVPGEPITWEGWEDSAVPVEHLGHYLRDFRRLLEKYGYNGALYGHFGQGCVHTRIDFDLESTAGIETYRAFTREAAETVTRYGGSLSGEHGDGQSRGELLPIMFGDELMEAFREFKSIWDPEGRMNPGKLIDAYPRDENLRLGSDYRPATPETHFKYPDDEGSFARAALRCVGVGLCRRHGGGIMCPSYMVLHEEKHTTRGRAHLLFEMLQGETIEDGWKSEEVKESLDLCLACKGCKGECPVNVDVATYKAEFLSHYYEGRLRPRQAYAFGLVFHWARLASKVPGLANLLTQTPGLRELAKAMAGMTPHRSIPRFARQTFKAWWRQRIASASRERRRVGDREPGTEAVTRPPAPYLVAGDGAAGVGRDGADEATRRVVLWPDTFNNHFLPGTLAAAAEVLEDAGFEVVVPEPFLCCGRPLYDWGLLDQAKRRLEHVIETLRPEIEAGTPIVGLEPSCVSVFRDELVNLFPENPEAARLAHQTSTLGEFLTAHAKEYRPRALRRKAVVHGHCHHKSVLNFTPEEEVLHQLGVDFHTLDSGCCGLAGSFGFEAGEKYDVSMAAGERVLFPAVREAADDTLIVADGFSCREQIAHGTDRGALHLAEVLQLALHSSEFEPGESARAPYPEHQRDRLAPPELTKPTSPVPSLIGLAAGTLAAGALAWYVVRRRSR